MTGRHRESANELMHVAVGVIHNDAGKVLIQRRDDGRFAGLWEYPGGKVEHGESASRALVRELAEEIGIEVRASRPLIRIRHDYAERSVLLETRVVTDYSGSARGLEGQATRWVEPSALFTEAMLPADRPITLAINLPDDYLRLGPPPRDLSMVAVVERALQSGARLIELPTASVDEIDAAHLARWRSAGRARFLVAGELDEAVQAMRACDADGVCVAAEAVTVARHERPLAADRLLAVTAREGTAAAAIGAAADLAIVPGTAAVGDWIDACNLPVYLDYSELAVRPSQAWAKGAQGVLRRAAATADGPRLGTGR